MSKKIISIFIVMVLALTCLCACNDGEKDDKSPNETQNLGVAFGASNFESYSYKISFKHTEFDSYYNEYIKNGDDYSKIEYNRDFQNIESQKFYIKTRNEKDYNGYDVYFMESKKDDLQSLGLGYSYVEMDAVNINFNQNLLPPTMFDFSVLKSDMFDYESDGWFNLKNDYKKQVKSDFLQDNSKYNITYFKVKVFYNKITDIKILMWDKNNAKYEIVFNYDKVVTKPNAIINNLNISDNAKELKFNLSLLNEETEGCDISEIALYEGQNRPHEEDEFIDLANIKDAKLDMQEFALSTEMALEEGKSYTIMIAIQQSATKIKNVYKYTFKYRRA